MTFYLNVGSLLRMGLHNFYRLLVDIVRVINLRSELFQSMNVVVL